MTPIILFASPDPQTRSAACAALESAGCLTLAAADGAEALDLVWRERGWIDVAFLELVMPRVGGLAATVRLRAVAPRVAVVLVCGNTEGAGGLVLARQADGVLRRPFRRGELLRAVQGGLERQRQRPKSVRAARVFRAVARRA
jgi:two-component system OmpR family response regulator